MQQRQDHFLRRSGGSGTSPIIDLESASMTLVDNAEGTLSLKTPSLDSIDSKKKQSPLPTAGLVSLPLLVIIWYSTASVAITSSKRIMMLMPLPFLLCTTQFVIASIVIGFYSRWSKTYRSIPPTSMSLVYQIAGSYTFGFIFTNIAFSLVSASFAETVKAAEPISSVLIGFLYLQERATTQTYLTLLPICVGVAVSCIHDDAFGWWGFLSAAFSNVCFSSRAVLTKYMTKHQGGSSGLDELSLFLHISNIGPLILVPFVVLFERNSLITQWSVMSWSNVLLFCMLTVVNGIAYATYNLMSFIGTCAHSIGSCPVVCFALFPFFLPTY